MFFFFNLILYVILNNFTPIVFILLSIVFFVFLSLDGREEDIDRDVDRRETGREEERERERERGVKRKGIVWYRIE